MNLLPNITILPMWAIFFSSFLVLYFLVFKPTIRIMLERQKKTFGLREQVQQFSVKAEQKFNEYESLMQKAKTLTQKERDQILKEAEEKQKQIIDLARQQAEQSLASVNKELIEQTQKAKTQLADSAQALAQEITNKLLSQRAA